MGRTLAGIRCPFSSFLWDCLAASESQPSRRLNFGRNIVIASLLLAAACIGLLWWRPSPQLAHPSAPLVVYCAAGLKPPVSEIARRYEARFGVPVQIQYGGSGTLLANLRVAAKGDLFIAADQSYMDAARSQRLVDEILPLAYLTPVLAVPRGNPKNVHSLEDAIERHLTFGMANPDAAAVGKVVRDLLVASGDWATFEKRVRVMKPTVNDVANDLKLGTVDVGVVWDATVAQYPELDAVSVAGWSGARQQVQAGVLKASQQPTAALRFARFMGARDAGLLVFATNGYRTIVGDLWAEQPELVLYSGGINRLAIEPTLREFEAREGVRVNRVYNGCGILVAQMKAGVTPDAFLACDASFFEGVKERFGVQSVLSETELAILVQQGNPRGLARVEDLARPGLKVGLGHPVQSALGVLTQRALDSLGLSRAVGSNVVVQSATADLLVNQLRAGGLDAAVVFRSNTTPVKDQLDVVEWDRSNITATQPYAVSVTSSHRLTAERLSDALHSASSRQAFERAGFRWRAGGGTP
jgi:molybdate transport system substrate-binding protein